MQQCYILTEMMERLSTVCLPRFCLGSLKTTETYNIVSFVFSVYRFRATNSSIMKNYILDAV